MTREEAIQHLENMKWLKGYSNTTVDGMPIGNIIDGIIALLKAQEPVKPVMDIDTWKCGNCGHTLEYQELLGDNVLFYEQYNYCPGCGKAVKWDE